MQYSAKPRASSKVYETVRESVTESCVLCLPCFWADWHHRGRLASEDSTCYYVGIQVGIAWAPTKIWEGESFCEGQTMEKTI